MRSAIFTICSCNYFHYAVTLMKSLEAAGSDERRYVVLVDEHYDPSEFVHAAFDTVSVKALGIPRAGRFCFKYGLLELNTAVKPSCFEYFFKLGFDAVVYLDPDIFVYRPLARIWEHLFHNDAVLTPHITSPLVDGYKPDDLDILRAGTFNLGFIGLRRSPEASAFIDWWKGKLEDECIVAHDKGIFVDQRWCDLLPSLVERTVIDRGPDLNVAYWNLAHREISLKDGSPWVGNRPVVFFHFSGLVLGTSRIFSKYENRFELSGLPQAVSSLISVYESRLRTNGLDRYAGHPYGFAFFSDGRTKVPEILRIIYRTKPEVRSMMPEDPFDISHDPLFTKSLNAFVDRKSGSPVTLLCREVVLHRSDLFPNAPDFEADGGIAPASWFVGVSKLLDMDDKFVAPVSNALAKLPLTKSASLKIRLRQIAARIDEIGRLSSESCDRTAKSFPERVFLKAFGNVRRFLKQRTSESFRRKVKCRLFGARYARPVSGVRLGHCRQIQPQRQLGLNIVGYVCAESGVGEAARSSARSAFHSGIRTAIIDFRQECHSRMGEEKPKSTSDGIDNAITLLHINADQMMEQASLLADGFLSPGYNIGFWMWETTDFPDKWIPAFEHLDEVWVASTFCLETIGRKAPVPMVRIPLCVEPETPALLSRDELGLPRNGFLFLAMADFLSTPERKNPLGALEAFHRAFGASSEEVYLVLKVINSEHRPEIREVMDQWANADSRIILVDGYLDRLKLNALVNQCDCLVSLHRAEGFGLPIAEAMFMGKPAVATGWSANMDFMNPDNSLPVRYGLIPVNRESGPYAGNRGVWADPDVDHAAWQMQRLVSDESLVTRLGEAARKTIREGYSSAAIGRLQRERLEFIHKYLLPGCAYRVRG